MKKKKKQNNLHHCIQTAFALRGCRHLRALLMAQLLFKPGEFMHRNLLLLVQDLLDTLHFLDLQTAC